MNKTKIIKFTIALIVAIVQLCAFMGSANAANIGETKTIKRGEKGYYCVQKWDGNKWIYLTYNQTFYTDTDGQQYIAYCLCPGMPGVGYVSGEKETYNVKIKELLNNDVIWRVLKNGYPNKSISELGVETADDAYFATMQAINAILRGHTIEQAKELYSVGKFAINNESFEDIQRRGTKTLDLMFKLMDIGLNGKETRADFLHISIKQADEFKKENDKFYSQTFKVQSSAEIAEFEIKQLEGLPEGSFITDLEGNKKQIFKGMGSFKINVPKEKIVTDFEAKISIRAKQKNYPIYYGASQIEGFQDYALCNNSYSDVEANVTMKVKTDISKLKIIKVDSETNKPLKGVKFKITFADKSSKEYITDEKGIINITNQKPGIIIVKEIETVGKYKLDSEERKIELKYDDSKEIKIENKLQKGNIKIIKVDKDNNEIKLSGVKFVLKDEGGKQVIEGVTDKNGELFFNNLVIGKYTVIEEETNEQYELSKDEFAVTVIDGTTKELKIENKKIVIPEVPKQEKIKEAKPQEAKPEIKKEVKQKEEVETETKVETIKKKLPKTGEDDNFLSKAVSMVLAGICMVCLIMIILAKKCL